MKQNFFPSFTCKNKTRTLMKAVEAFKKLLRYQKELTIEPIKNNLNPFTLEWYPRRDMRNTMLFTISLNHQK